MHTIINNGQERKTIKMTDSLSIDTILALKVKVKTRLRRKRMLEREESR